MFVSEAVWGANIYLNTLSKLSQRGEINSPSLLTLSLTNNAVPLFVSEAMIRALNTTRRAEAFDEGDSDQRLCLAAEDCGCGGRPRVDTGCEFVSS